MSSENPENLMAQYEDIGNKLRELTSKNMTEIKRDDILAIVNQYNSLSYDDLKRDCGEQKTTRAATAIGHLRSILSNPADSLENHYATIELARGIADEWNN